MATDDVKLETCEVCNVNKAKYTCPKCEVRTCSLPCINIHKRELACDGIRSKTKFIPMKQFTDLDLLSDYRLLEQIGRSIKTSKKNMEQKKIITHSNLPMHLYKLRAAAYKKKVQLLFMPQVFTRHKENTTFLEWKTNELFWRIEWVFPHAENAKCIMEKVLDSVKVSKLVQQVLDPISTCKGEVNIETLNAKLNLSDTLQYYRAAGMSDITVLLKAERVKQAKTKFYDLDVRLSLRENLENKTIVEFPTFYLIMKEHLYMFKIVDSDDEIESLEPGGPSHEKNELKRKSSNGSLSSISSSSNEKIKKGESVNYFFDNFSESDDEKTDGKSQENNQFSSALKIPFYEDLIKNSGQ